MPAFYQRPMANSLPLTPPDSGSRYGYSSMHYPQDPYASYQAAGQSRHDTNYDYQQPYMSHNVAPAPPAYRYQQNGYQANNSLPPLQRCYDPIGAPILPPLRIQDPVSFTDDYQRRLHQEQQNTVAREQQRQPPKDEKPTGGVSAKLDYEMERMTDFVADMTQKMYAYHHSPICIADIDVTRSFGHEMQSPSSFRKWVHQVLSATRLPSATILLSLHFLNDRLARFPDSVPSGENHVYRMLAVCLILGSKFLDDNTFINRSWSDVTAIKIKELNFLEVEWLQLIEYNLHIDPQTCGGLQAWLDSWKTYDANRTAKQQQAARLSPLNTDVYRSMTGRDRFSPYPTPYNSAVPTRGHNTPTNTRPVHHAAATFQPADPWAPVSQQAFDDFYKRTRRYPTLTEIDDVNRRVSQERARQTAYAHEHAAYSSYYNSPTYTSPWNQHAWNGGAHPYDCTCSSCIYNYRSYPMTSSYAPQTVMG